MIDVEKLQEGKLDEDVLEIDELESLDEDIDLEIDADEDLFYGQEHDMLDLIDPMDEEE